MSEVADTTEKVTLQERRRRQITDAARRIIATSGVEGTRMTDVADEAGVSVGMIQHYFRSRDALIAASFERFFDDSRVSWKAAMGTESSAVTRLSGLLSTVVRTHMPPVELYKLWLELHAAAMRAEALQALTMPWWDEWLAEFEDVIAQGIAQREFTPAGTARDVAIRLVSLVDGLTVHVVNQRYGLTEKEMYRHVVVAAANDLGVPVEAMFDPAVVA